MTLYENDLTPAVYNALRESVGWTPHPADRAAPALARSLYTVTARVGDTPIGMARLVGDGLYMLLVDVAVAPAWQGRGVGQALVAQTLFGHAVPCPPGPAPPCCWLQPPARKVFMPGSASALCPPPPAAPAWNCGWAGCNRYQMAVNRAQRKNRTNKGNRTG